MARLPPADRREASLVEGQPDEVAAAVATVTMRGLGEGISQFPLLRFVAPLHGRVRDDVVGLAVGADRRDPSRLAAVEDLGGFVARTERIEKRRVCHIVPVEAVEIQKTDPL